MLTEIARGVAELYCKPPAYRTISKVLFSFKQQISKMLFGLMIRMSSIAYFAGKYNYP